MKNILCTIRQRASLVIKLIDDYTGNPIKDAKLEIIDYESKPINKKDGYYIFTNLDDGIYGVLIKAENRLNQRIKVEIYEGFAKEGILKIRMKQKVKSPLIRNVTSLLLCFEDDKNRPIIDKEVKVVYEESKHSNRIIEKAQKNSTYIKLYTTDQEKLEGKEFIIKNINSKEKCVIESFDPIEKTLKLKNFLDSILEVGTSLYPVWRGRTDEEGKCIIPFSYSIEDQLEININILLNEKNIEDSIKIYKGKVNIKKVVI